MEKLISVFLFFCLFTANISAQLVTPVKIRAENFPIGGMDISTVFPNDQTPNHTAIADWMTAMGFNTYFLQDYYPGKYDIAKHLLPGMTMYAGTANYHDGNLLFATYCGAKGVYPSTERRFFLATTPDQTANTPYGIKSDYERIDLHHFQYDQENHFSFDPNPLTNHWQPTVWQTIQGAYVLDPDPIKSHEWLIPVSDPITKNLLTGDLLNLELKSIDGDNDGSHFESNLPVWSNSGLTEFHINNTKLLVDFIFKFDGDITSQPESLYTVTATVYNDDNSVASATTLHLTKTLYGANNDFETKSYHGNKDQGIDYNNPKSIFWFPNPKLSATFQTEYAVARMDPLGTNPIDIGQFNVNAKHKVVFTLTRFVDNNNHANDNTTVPIYVRGFRIRTKMCDDILANNSVPDPTISGTPSIHMDDQIKTDFFAKLVTELHPDNTTESNSMWDRTTYIGGPNEPTRECFRVYTYIDHLLSNYMNDKSKVSYNPKKMNLYGFLTQNVSSAYAEYRAIYEDEMGQIIPPPFILAEGTWNNYVRGGIKDVANVIPRDGIANEIRTDPGGFEDLGYPVVPATGSSNLSGGYSTYTNSWHGTPTTEGYQNATSNDHEDVARSAIPDINWDKSRKTVWYSMPMAMWSPDWKKNPVLLPEQLGGTARPDVANTLINNPTSSTISLYEKGADVRNLVTHLASSSSSNQTSQLEFPVRGPIATELRYDAWDAIAWGAKGIIFNTIGSDRGANVGICDEQLRSDVDSWNKPGNSDHVGFLDFQLGDCDHPFFSATFPESGVATPAFNYSKRLIKYTGNSDDLPISGLTNQRACKFQWVPLSEVCSPTGNSPTNARQSDLNTWMTNNSATNTDVVYDINGNTSGTWATLKTACSTCLGSGKWRPVAGVLHNTGDDRDIGSACPEICTFSSSDIFSAGKVIVIGSKTYHLVNTTPSSEGDILVDANQTTTINRIVACIKDGGGGNYKRWNDADPTADHTDPDVTVVTSGTPSNSFTIKLKLASSNSSTVAYAVKCSTDCSNASWSEKSLNSWVSFFDGYKTHDWNYAISGNPTNDPFLRGPANDGRNYLPNAIIRLKAICQPSTASKNGPTVQDRL